MPIEPRIKGSPLYILYMSQVRCYQLLLSCRNSCQFFYLYSLLKSLVPTSELLGFLLIFMNCLPDYVHSETVL